MEFPDLGERCSWSSCKNLDFLPLTCDHCKQIFCKEHFNQHTHECVSSKSDIDNLTGISSFVCTSEGCTSSSPVEMLCQKCQKHFCLVHRYHNCFDIVDDIEAKKRAWDKPKEQFTESLKTVNDTINHQLKKAIQDPKKQETALKIQLMRLKGKAEGSSSVPATDRIYFLLVFPKGSALSSKAVFVSKDWSVGKVIDALSNICNVINKNSELNAPKLRLFKISNGCQISSDTSAKIADLINNSEINNGETLILEYVSPDADLKSYELNDLAKYNKIV